MRSMLPPSVDSQLDKVIAREMALPDYYPSREELNAAFMTWVQNNQDRFTSDWSSSPLLAAVHDAFDSWSTQETDYQYVSEVNQFVSAVQSG